VTSPSQRLLPASHTTNTTDKSLCPQWVITWLQAYALDCRATGIGILYRTAYLFLMSMERCPCECPEGIRESGITASIVLNFVNRWSWMTSFRPRPYYSARSFPSSLFPLNRRLHKLQGWSGRLNKDRNLLFLQELVTARSTTTTPIEQYWPFIMWI